MELLLRGLERARQARSHAATALRLIEDQLLESIDALSEFPVLRVQVHLVRVHPDHASHDDAEDLRGLYVRELLLPKQSLELGFIACEGVLV